MSKARDIASAPIAPSTVSATELGYVDGVTSAIQTQLDAKTAKSTLTTTGDIYYASAANTPARLGIGSSAQVLTVAAGVPSWATASSGGMTLLTTHSLSGSTSTISSISGSYKSLFGVIIGAVTNGSGANWKIDPNGNTTITNTATLEGNNGTAAVYAYTATWYMTIAQYSKVSGGENCWSFTIDNYASTTNHKPVQMYGQWIKPDDALASMSNGGGIRTNSAITSLDFVTLSGSWTAGTVLLYGVS